MSSAGGFPGWVMLEPYVFRRDDNKSFPDVTEAPIRASGTTSWGAYFRIAFSLAEPPQISCLYAQLPGFPGPKKEDPLAMLATHRQLSLLVVATIKPSKGLLQNFFIFRANEDKPSSSSLTVLPPCTLPRFDYSRADGSLPRRRPRHLAPPRLLDLRSLGLWCGGDKEDFVVAELTPYVPTIERRRTNAFADIRLLRSSTTDVQLGRRKWGPLRIPILSTTSDDLWKLSCWQTDTVIPFQQWLCWVDYHQGIIFCDVSNKDKVHVSFFWFPLDVDTSKPPRDVDTSKPPRDVDTSTSPLDGDTSTDDDGDTSNDDNDEPSCNIYYGGVSVVDHGRLLKFVNVKRHDGLDYGALKPGIGFTITCHTLLLGGGSMEWKKDYTVTSDELPEYLQCGVPIFPQVDIERPHVVHFLFIEFGKPYEKMSLLSIDMSTRSLEYFHLYMDGNEFLKSDGKPCVQGLDADFIATKTLSPTSTPFLPCEFPRFCCQAKTPTINESQATGSKTIFVRNLSYSIRREQVKQFFEEAGEVVDVRLSTFEDGSFKGYGHVEFATAEAAQKALGFAHRNLMGRPVWVELAHQRGAYTPGSGRDNSSFKSAPRSGKTAYIEGFDKSIGEDQIRSALQEHFRSCGEITHVSIPKDHETGASKGIAYIDFKDPDSLDKAYQLNASDLGGYLLYIDQAMPGQTGFPH